MAGKYQAPTVKKAFQILKAISDSPGGLRISEISKKLGISKSTVHGISAALEDLSVVARDPSTKRYTLGLTLFELGRSAFARIDLKEVVRPFLEELMKKATESVFFGVKSGGHVTILDVVESRRDLKISAPIGTTIPLLAGATGKVFLGSMKEEEAVNLIKEKGVHSYTDKTVTDPILLLEELRKARARGFAVDDEEYIEGVRAVAAPVPGSHGMTFAIWVVGFKSSLDDKRMKALEGWIKETVDAIGRETEAAY